MNDLQKNCIRVLIVDDEVKISDLIKENLMNISDNYYAINTYSGNEALLLLKSEHFDVLVTDIRMPQMDGLELMQQALDLFPDLQVIIVSQHNEFRYAIDAMRIGALNYILKPVSTEELDLAIQKAYQTAQLSIRLKESEKRYKELVENAKTAIIKIDTDGYVLFVNEYAKTLFEWNKQELIGKKLTDYYVIDEKDMKSHFNKYNEIPHECMNLKASGKEMWILWVNKKLYEHKIHMGWILIGYNITDQKKVEQLNLAKQTAEQANEAKTLFLSNMSHEIRTPLNAIQGFVSLIHDELNDYLSSKIKNYINIIIKSVDKLLYLVDYIIDFSSIDVGKVKISKNKFELKELMTKIERHVSILSESNKSISYNIHISEEMPVLFWGDKSRIEQVLKNLISNAFKFTDKGIVEIFVSLTSESNMLFEVRDTGIGIPEYKQVHIFDKFYQVDNSLTKRYSGVGLGLSISKKLVELMGGHIWLKSEEGKGTSFYFSI